MRRTWGVTCAALLIAVTGVFIPPADAQRRTDEDRKDARSGVSAVTIPVVLRLPDRRDPESELQYIEGLSVFENGERQEILSTRGAPLSPLTLAILIQDDLESTVANDVKEIANFVRRLPQGSRVMVGYLRGGSVQIRQKFTNDLERAAKSLRIPISSVAASPYNPFALTREALKRFESQPVGRRAVLLVSDGLDLSQGMENASPTQSIDLRRAISEAQRRSVAVYSIYAPAVGGGTGRMATFGQGALNRLSSETGGKAFFQGTIAPLSFEPFLREINNMLSRQFALTYLSTHTEKGFRRVRVVADLAEGEVYHPAGYVR